MLQGNFDTLFLTSAELASALEIEMGDFSVPQSHKLLYLHS